jgi:predicted transcriptional regulator
MIYHMTSNDSTTNSNKILQINRKLKEEEDIDELVYSAIKSKSGKITTKHLEKEIGSKKSQREVQYAIIHLTKKGKIRRVRGFGLNGIEYYYHAIISK